MSTSIISVPIPRSERSALTRLAQWRLLYVVNHRPRRASESMRAPAKSRVSLRALEPRPACCGVRGGGLASLSLRAEKPPWEWRTGNGRISATGAEAGTATRPNLLARQSARNQKRFDRSIPTHAREDRMNEQLWVDDDKQTVRSQFDLNTLAASSS